METGKENEIEKIEKETEGLRETERETKLGTGKEKEIEKIKKEKEKKTAKEIFKPEVF